ncbi:MAG: formate acetyltransferase [Actinobacteria bacterium]|nr:formate acetyltransferase [Actinomycetota bacterium]
MEKHISYIERINNLSRTKAEHTGIKIKRGLNKKSSTSTDLAALDADDKGIIPPPEDFEFKLEPNHPSGGVFGPVACGSNYRKLLENHPVYIDPNSSLAGGYMFNFWEMSNPVKGKSVWNPDFDFSFLKEDQEKYGIIHGIGDPQHFYQDINIGFKLGWKGILEKIRYYKKNNYPSGKDFYKGLEDIVLGIQNWIHRHAVAAEDYSKVEENPVLRENLIEMARINRKLVTEPPETFHEAVQWFAWFIMSSLMYNGNGTGGAIDVFLKPFYDNDKLKGILTDEEAMFHLACLLIKDNEYYQIGGTDINGNDMTNPISFLLLEAAHLLKIPTSIYLRVHEKQDPKLLEKAVEILFEDRNGSPNFVSDENLNSGFIKNGYTIELARQREKCGCHWCNIPGREFTHSDLVKINFVSVFDVTLKEVLNSGNANHSVNNVWDRFVYHLGKAVEVAAKGIDFHIEYMHEIFPELVLDLLCYGSIERGIDASHGSLEFYNLGVDGAGLATVADSFAAIEQKVEIEKCLSWQEIESVLKNNYKDAENIRLMLKNIDRYGSGGSRADEYGVRISSIFTEIVKEKSTPKGFNMIPGIFSWALDTLMGKYIGATPNGRFANEPISHGANPDPGSSDSITALAIAVASIQSGYGNSCPLQLDIDPILGNEKESQGKFIAFIKAFFDLGGTLLNVNILDKKKILDANENPSKYPDLIVRVTGFSTYFAGLSKEWRQLIVNRIIESS